MEGKGLWQNEAGLAWHFSGETEKDHDKPARETRYIPIWSRSAAVSIVTLVWLGLRGRAGLALRQVLHLGLEVIDSKAVYWMLLAQDRVQSVCQHVGETPGDIIQRNIRTSRATIVCSQGSEIRSPHSFVIEGSVCLLRWCLSWFMNGAMQNRR